jgi:hypothetical protein
MQKTTETYISDHNSKYEHTLVMSDNGEISSSWARTYKNKSENLRCAAYVSQERCKEINEELKGFPKNERLSRLIKILENEPTFKGEEGLIPFVSEENKSGRSSKIKERKSSNDNASNADKKP